MKSRKELKNEYKQMKPQMGVFQIKNGTNNKILLDSSTNMNAKWNRHRTELKFGSHKNSELQKDWNEMGEAQFVFEILSQLTPKQDEPTNVRKEVQILEEMYVEELQPFGGKGYHIKKT